MNMTLGNATLEELFVADPLGTAHNKLEALFMAQYGEADTITYDDPAVEVALREVGATLLATRERAPEQMAGITGADFDTKEGRERVAQIIGVELEAMEHYHTGVQARLAKMRGSDTNRQIFALVDEQKRAWDKLSAIAPITTVRPEHFPFKFQSGDRPIIVFFSGNQCIPCHMRKPAFALLAKYFRGASLAFCTDIPDDKVRIPHVPHLVLFNRVGGKIHADLPNTTRELWELLGALVLHGEFAVEELLLDMNAEGEKLTPYVKNG